MSAGHVLIITIEDDGDPSYRIECLRTGRDRSCAVWYQHPTGAPCTCECEPCTEGDHGDCESDEVEEVGRKFCQCSPADECWYQHALDQGGREMLDFGRSMFTVRVPVDLTGSGFDESIDVSLHVEATP